MHHFAYRDNELFAEDVAIKDIVKRFGTPVYIYSAATLRRHFRVFDEAFAGTDHLICYAMKALSNLSILKLFGAMGSGFDIVSAGELMRCLRAGADPAKIVFSGVGKSDRGNRGGAGRRHPDVQRRIAPRTAPHRRGGPAKEAQGAGQPAGQSRPRPRHSSAHLNRPSQQQIRNPPGAGLRVLRGSPRPARPGTGRTQHPYRIADHGHRTVYRSGREGGANCQPAQSRRHRAEVPRYRRRPGYSLSGGAAPALRVCRGHPEAAAVAGSEDHRGTRAGCWWATPASW